MTSKVGVEPDVEGNTVSKQINENKATTAAECGDISEGKAHQGEDKLVPDQGETVSEETDISQSSEVHIDTHTTDSIPIPTDEGGGKAECSKVLDSTSSKTNEKKKIGNEETEGNEKFIIKM